MADPDDKGRMGGEKNICFPPFGPQFGLKMKERGGGGRGGPPGPLLWIRHCKVSTRNEVSF